MRSPVTTSLEPIAHVELHNRDQTADHLHQLTVALVSLSNRACAAHTSTLAS